MEAVIQVTTVPVDQKRCTFILDRMVHSGGTARFPSLAAAKGSPLPERLFAIENVTAVYITDNEVSVDKSGSDDWTETAPRVEEAIRAHLLSARPAIDEDPRIAFPPAIELEEEGRISISSGVEEAARSALQPKANAERPRVPEAGGIREKVQYILDTSINPGVAAHGGVITLLDVQGKRVFIQMGGGCQGCGMADVTLKQGVERMIREAVPEVEEVLDATDHAEGNNPYYAPSK